MHFTILNIKNLHTKLSIKLFMKKTEPERPMLTECF